MKEKKPDLPTNLDETLGTSTGGAEHSTVAGGWAGTDDATSTSVSDKMGLECAELDEESIEKTLEKLEERAAFEDEVEQEEQAESDELEELKDLAS